VYFLDVLFKNEKSSIELYLQTDFWSLFMVYPYWFLVFIKALWHSHCSWIKRRKKDSYCALIHMKSCLLIWLFARLEDVSYITTADDGGMNIRLLSMKKHLSLLFPPMPRIREHELLMEWLYSVYFPSPLNTLSWKNSSGNDSIITHKSKS